MEYTLQEDLIGKYLSGELSAREEADLMAWVDANPQNREVFEEMTQLWSLTEVDTEPTFPVNLSKAWTALDSRLDMGEFTNTLAEPVVSPAKPAPALQVVKEPVIRSLNRIWSAAAAIAVLLVAGWWIFMRETGSKTLEYSTADNQSRSITLPDQSKIVLNENSTLAYTFDGKNRQVELSGEAFFDVEKDPKHPFVIHSGEVETKVLGTSFNIRAYPDEAKIKVSVKTGRVEVRKVQKSQPEAAPALVLLPGNAGVYSTKDAVLEKAPDIATEDVNSWQQGSVVIPEGAYFSDVIPELEKLYDIKIQIDPSILGARTSKMRFSQDMSIEVALTIFTGTFGGKFMLENGIYVITSEGK